MAEDNQLVIYKHSQGFELEMIKNKSIKWREWDTQTGDCRIVSPTCWPLSHVALSLHYNNISVPIQYTVFSFAFDLYLDSKSYM